jgi:hypothetical protein
MAEEETISWFAGVDWGSEKHQVCLLDAQGTTVGGREFPHSGEGLAELGDWLLSMASAANPMRSSIAQRAIPCSTRPTGLADCLRCSSVASACLRVSSTNSWLGNRGLNLSGNSAVGCRAQRNSGRGRPVHRTRRRARHRCPAGASRWHPVPSQLPRAPIASQRHATQLKIDLIKPPGDSSSKVARKRASMA